MKMPAVAGAGKSGQHTAVLDSRRNSGHTPAMTIAQRLPASLTPLEVAQAALLRELKRVAARQRTGAASTCDAPGLNNLTAWPPYDMAAVDGWALRASDLVGASSYTPLPLMTQPIWVEAGDGIPAGCDCVLDQDLLDQAGPIVQALAEAIPGQGIRRKGGEIRDGSGIIAAWRVNDLQGGAQHPRLRIVNAPGGAITAKLIAGSLQQASIETTFVEAAARDQASIARLLDDG